MSPLKSMVPMFFLVVTQLSAAQPNPFTGEWVSYSNNGIYVSSDTKCVGRSMEERRYIINPAGGVLIASYASIWHMRWVRRESSDCAFPTLTPKQGYIGSRFWFVDMTRVDKQTYEARANFKECRGDVCTLENVSQSSFTTTLVAKNGQLLDIFKDQKDPKPLVFEPLAKAQREATSTAKAFIEKWREMKGDNATFESIRPLLGPNFNSDERTSRLLRQYYVTRLTNSSGYKLIEAYILAPSANGSPQNTPVMFMSIGNEQIDGSIIGETYELAYLNGSWKLLGFQF